MTDFKSPFLESSDSSSIKNDDNIADENFQAKNQNNKFTPEKKEEGAIEINDKNSLFKKIVITLITILILVILALLLYNFLNKRYFQPQALNNNPNVSNSEYGNFEMVGKIFKADSIIIE